MYAVGLRRLLLLLSMHSLANSDYFDCRFALFNNNVTGKFEELEPNKSIRQSWRYKEWPAGHYSNVHLELEEADGMTVLKLHQDGVPTSEVERTRQNWNNYYWQSIKMTFGFGSFLG